MTMDLCLDLRRATDRFRIGMPWWRDLIGLQPGSVIVRCAANDATAVRTGMGGKTTELTRLRARHSRLPGASRRRAPAALNVLGTMFLQIGERPETRQVCDRQQ